MGEKDPAEVGLKRISSARWRWIHCMGRLGAVDFSLWLLAPSSDPCGSSCSANGCGQPAIGHSLRVGDRRAVHDSHRVVLRRLAARFPAAGGEYPYTLETFGPFSGISSRLVPDAVYDCDLRLRGAGGIHRHSPKGSLRRLKRRPLCNSRKSWWRRSWPVERDGLTKLWHWPYVILNIPAPRELSATLRFAHLKNANCNPNA